MTAVYWLNCKGWTQQYATEREALWMAQTLSRRASCDVKVFYNPTPGPQPRLSVTHLATFRKGVKL